MGQFENVLSISDNRQPIFDFRFDSTNKQINKTPVVEHRWSKLDSTLQRFNASTNKRINNISMVDGRWSIEPFNVSTLQQINA